MSRIVSILLGLYTGLVLDQHFEIPRVPMPSTVIEQVKELWDQVFTEENGSGGNGKEK